jgi:predicted O-methyltransferase YrrM
VTRITRLSIHYLSQAERRLSLRRLAILLLLLIIAATTAASSAMIMLGVANTPTAAVVGAALSSIFFSSAAALTFGVSILRCLRQQGRSATELTALRVDLRAVRKDILDTAGRLQGVAELSLDQEAEMLTTVLENVLGLDERLVSSVETSQAHDRELQRYLQEVIVLAKQSADAEERGSVQLDALQERLRAIPLQHLRQTQGLLALHSLLPASRSLPPLGDWAVSADAAASLVELVLEHEPDKVVELGSGTSTVLLAYALRQLGRGTLVALEHDSDFAQRTQQDLESRGLQQVARVALAPLVPTRLGADVFSWYDLAEAELPNGIDMLFVDGPPAGTGPLARYPAVPLLWTHLSPDAVVVLDDAGRSDEERIVSRWLHEQHELNLTHLAHERGTAILRRRA